MIEVEPGEEVTLETRDAMDLQIGPRTTVKDLEKMERTVAHPLTGPVYVKGAKPGDLLEIEHLDILPERYGWTRFSPGFGFLPDLFDRYFVVHWDITPEYATSAQLPGVRIPNGAFMGTAGVAPSREQLKRWSAREKDLADRGGKVMLPTAAAAVPGQGPVAEEGLRTIPPRENCGNADVKQLTRGSKLYVPVAVDGALYSVGDGHFAQGDAECCGTAIEMGATAVVRFRVSKDEAKTKAHRLAALLASRLLREAGARLAGQFHRHHGDAGHGRGPAGGRRPYARGAQRGDPHDRAARGARLVARAGLRAVQRGGGPAGEQRGRRAERHCLRVAARRHLLVNECVLGGLCQHTRPALWSLQAESAEKSAAVVLEKRARGFVVVGLAAFAQVAAFGRDRGDQAVAVHALRL